MRFIGKQDKAAKSRVSRGGSRLSPSALLSTLYILLSRAAPLPDGSYLAVDPPRGRVKYKRLSWPEFRQIDDCRVTETSEVHLMG